MHVLKKNKQKVTPEAINQMVSNIALRNKIKNPDLIFPGQKLVLEFEREVTANLDAVLKDLKKLKINHFLLETKIIQKIYHWLDKEFRKTNQN